ncbi:hypothetical protein BKA82DRAFT_4351773 [Pisolithus tinctorius]|nr:hypothetical protein BKA82DRAFT_4351773 [Pisolithus tinctorius]
MGSHHSHEPEPDWAAIEQAKRERQAAEERQRQAEEAARHAREAAERAAREAEERRQREREAQLAAERAAQAAREEAERMRRWREEAERAERKARQEAEARTREERARAERIAREMEEERQRLQAAAEAKRLAAIAAREEEARRQRVIEEEAQRARKAQEEAERQAREAAEAARKAQAEREEVERQLKKGIQPVVMPSVEEIRFPRRSGKSSLINALCGMSNSDSNAAPTGVNETTLEIARYIDSAHSKQFAWYDVPGSGTLTIPDWQYFNSQGLYVFDCILVLFNNRFTMTDQAILANCRRFNIPTFIEDTDSRAQFYKVAREKYISETRQSVKNNLTEANLPDQRVYIVSNKTLSGVVKDRGPKRIIDEVELLTDLYNEAYRSGKFT